MIKNFMFTLGLILILTNLLAQNDKDSNFEIGVELGPNVAFIYKNNLQSNESKPFVAFSGGFSFQLNLSRIFSLRTIPSFERKAAQSEEQVISGSNGNVLGTYTSTTRSDYFVIPILVKGQFGKKVKFIANIGPYFAFLMSSKTSTNTSNNVSGNSNVDGATNVGHFLGVSIGLGIAVPIKSRFAITIEIRNNTDLLGLSKYNNYYYNSTNLLFGFSYKFFKRNKE